jgi:RND family efflux transporter MFP subunit
MLLHLAYIAFDVFIFLYYNIRVILRSIPTILGRFILPVIVIITVIAIIRGCTNSEETIAPDEQIRPKVDALEIAPGLTRQFAVTGEVTADKSSSITAETRATVTEINVKIGDTVEEDDLLLSLESDSVRERFSTANVSYATALQNLEQTRLTAQTNVEAARSALTTAEVNLRTLLIKNEALRFQAEETLNSAQINLDLSVSSATTALDNVVNTTKVIVGDAIRNIDELLEYSPVHADLGNIQEVHIGVRNPSFKIQAKYKLGDTYKTYNSYSPSYENALALSEEVDATLSVMLQVLNNSVTSTTDYPQSSLDSDISDISGHINTVRDLIASLRSAKETLDTAKQSTGSKSQTIISAEKTYAATIAELDGSEETAKRAVEESQIALENSIASASVSEIGARASLTTAGGDLTQARISNDKNSVASPLAGKVLDILVKVGDEVQAGDTLVSVENDELLKIIAFVSSEEVRSLDVGDAVKINGKGQARIATIAPSADPATKKYKVEILHRDKELSGGEFVTLRFSAGSNNGDKRIFVPITSVQITTNDVYVWKISASGSVMAVEKAPVTVGDIQGAFVEIIDGLIEGDVIVTEGGRSIDRAGVEVDISNSPNG